MEGKTLTTKEVILRLLKGEQNLKAFFADNDAVWRVEYLEPSERNSSGYHVMCSVSSIYGNGIGYGCFGQKQEFLFQSSDNYIFFENEDDALERRAEIICYLMEDGEWFETK